jgi:hypothetical protein
MTACEEFDEDCLKPGTCLNCRHSRDAHVPSARPPEFEPRYRLARQTLRAAVREQLDRSLPLAPRDLETATDEMLLRLTAPSLANVLQIVAGAHGVPAGD